MWIRLIPSGVLANDMRFWSSCDYDVARRPSWASIGRRAVGLLELLLLRLCSSFPRIEQVSAPLMLYLTFFEHTAPIWANGLPNCQDLEYEQAGFGSCPCPSNIHLTNAPFDELHRGNRIGYAPGSYLKASGATICAVEHLLCCNSPHRSERVRWTWM